MSRCPSYVPLPVPFRLPLLPFFMGRGASPIAAAFLESRPAALGVYATPMRSLAACIAEREAGGWCFDDR